MLRLMIADDERIIRETIRNLIDWESLGIKLTGLCKNGLEAYDMILDEYPDIVLTDIRMPGLSGLELIEKIHLLDPSIHFIILSGYEEFSYAKQAMKFGVKHYLLKPCNESQIIESIKETIADIEKEPERELHSNKNSRISSFQESSGSAEQLLYKDFIVQTMEYVNDHLSDPALSLKWIAENVLFMNVDYVSKQFVKQTGTKFSTYLCDLRIARAKTLLESGDSDKIYEIATQVGCGNNPQYFTQLFKKSTGLTPSAYIQQNFSSEG